MHIVDCYPHITRNDSELLKFQQDKEVLPSETSQARYSAGFCNQEHDMLEFSCLLRVGQENVKERSTSWSTGVQKKGKTNPKFQGTVLLGLHLGRQDKDKAGLSLLNLSALFLLP